MSLCWNLWAVARSKSFNKSPMAFLRGRLPRPQNTSSGRARSSARTIACTWSLLRFGRGSLSKSRLPSLPLQRQHWCVIGIPGQSFTSALEGKKFSLIPVNQFVFAHLCLPSLKHIVWDAVRTHSIFSELPHAGARRFAGESIHSFSCPAEFDSRRVCHEVDLPARFTRDSHMNLHSGISARRGKGWINHGSI